MAFVRKKVKTFKWPVEVKEPSENDPGKFDTHEFIAVFNRVARSVIVKMADEDEGTVLNLILAGWEGIEDENGKPLPFSAKNVAELADDPYWIKGVINAYSGTYNEAELGN
tara:strand:- start:159 stop:491 length:333 start_codon:yes stop_codon:yes gene_type:complete